MKSFFRFFAERSLFANLITLSVIGIGLLAAPNIKRDMFPRVDLGEVVVTTIYPGASSEDVELFITNKIEKNLKGIDGIEEFTSSSVEGVSSIRVKLDVDAKNLRDIKQKVREAIDKTQSLPEEAQDPLIYEVESANFPVLEIAIKGDVPYEQLYNYAKQFETKLENIDGVSSLQSYGLNAREVKIYANSKRLEQYQLSLSDIFIAINAQNRRSSIGKLEEKSFSKNILINSQFSTPLEVGNVILRSNFSGQLVKVKDLAIIQESFEKPSMYSRTNGVQSINFMVFKRGSADIIRTINRINDLIKKENKYVNSDISISSQRDLSFYIKNRLNVMISNGVIGLILVCIVLTLFLNIRMAFWVAMGIPVAVLGTIFVLTLNGFSLNVVSLMSLIIVIGIIVDDGIIVAESIKQEFEKGKSAVEAAASGIQTVFKPVITTIITTFIAFLPFFFMEGIMGKFIFIIPVVITLALLFSLIEVTIALPAHVVPSLSKISKTSLLESKRLNAIKKIKNIYLKWLKKALMNRYKIALFFIILFTSSILYAAKYLDFVLFSKDQADAIAVQIELPVETTLEETSQKTKEIEKIILSINPDYLVGFSSRIGMKGGFEYISKKQNHSTLLIDLIPSGLRDKTAQEIVKSLRQQTDKLKLDGKVRYLIDAGGPPVGRSITLRIIGANDKQRKQLTDEVYNFIKSQKGVTEINRNDISERDQLEIVIDKEKAARLGISISNAIQVFRIAYTGLETTSVRFNNEDVGYRLILNPESRKSIKILKSLTVPNNTNRQIPLSEFAKISQKPGDPNYYHYNNQRTVTLEGDLNDDIITSLKLTELVQSNFDLDRDWPGLRFEFGGEGKETAKSVKNLNKSFLGAIAGIFLILILLFNSFLQPILVILAIPFGLIGVIIAFGLHQQDLGFISSIGTVGLSGVVVNDSLVMVNHINVLKEKFPQRSILDIVLEGAADRLRAIILTSLTTIAGLLPLAYGIGGADPFIAPMALALGYGLFFSTPLILFFLPCFYLILHDIQEKIANKKEKNERLNSPII
tara:strand:+ start:814 stop:3927 length:3114 start_codon:yes stop_codon:yes gene_type:complete